MVRHSNPGVSDRRSGGRHVARGEPPGALARLVHPVDDVGAADELALDVELRHRRPVGEFLDPWRSSGSLSTSVAASELQTQLIMRPLRNTERALTNAAVEEILAIERDRGRETTIED